jgi:hypothetical protein
LVSGLMAARKGVGSGNHRQETNTKGIGSSRALMVGGGIPGPMETGTKVTGRTASKTGSVSKTMGRQVISIPGSFKRENRMATESTSTTTQPIT